MDLSLQKDISRQYHIFNCRRNKVARRRIRNNGRSNRMMAFCVNPYDVVLNLRDKDDRKVYFDGCKALKDDDLFDGSKEKYKDFVS